MRKIIFLLLVVLPLFSYSQTERALLEKDIHKFIVATNYMDCNALLHYAPRSLFAGTSEEEFLLNCEYNRKNPLSAMKKTMKNLFVVDTLVAFEGSQYAKVTIPTEVIVEFADAEATEEFHSDPFYYRLIEAYCDELLDRPDIGEINVDHENHKVYYTCQTSLLALWEMDHWTFLPSHDSEALPPLDVMDPDILYQ